MEKITKLLALVISIFLYGCSDKPPTNAELLQAMSKDMEERRHDQANKYAYLGVPADTFDWEIASIKVIECRKETNLRYNCTIVSRIRFGDDYKDSKPIDKLFLKTDSGWVVHKHTGDGG